MRNPMSSPWWRDSNQTASGKPGAVQTPFWHIDAMSGAVHTITPDEPRGVVADRDGDDAHFPPGSRSDRMMIAEPGRLC